jgi:hypothetical protein
MEQFAVDHQRFAAALLDAMVTVSGQEFLEDLKSLILSLAKSGTPIALYAEREVRKWKGIPNRLFRETNGRVKRAIGVGPSPVKPTRVYNPEVGSEGLVAHLITELSRSHKKVFLNHPGPNEIRRKRVRTFFVITDFVGSGGHVWDYLEAMWRVRSVKSWHSGGRVRFHVICYAAMDSGQKRLTAHPCRPELSTVRPCPTIETQFSEKERSQIEDLCYRYDPVSHDHSKADPSVPDDYDHPHSDRAESLGYDGGGALLAFAHGIPNNAPRLLHRTGKVNGKPWIPLFPARVTASLRKTFGGEVDADLIENRLKAMRQKRLARAPWLKQASTEAKKLILVLAALARGPRFSEAIARRSGLTLPEVEGLISRASDYGWIDPAGRLTDRGHKELSKLRGWRREGQKVLQEPSEPYYPSTLRAPYRPSS